MIEWGVGHRLPAATLIESTEMYERAMQVESTPLGERAVTPASTD